MKNIKLLTKLFPKDKRRSFTLLEIMLALFILTIAAGFMGWKAKELLDRHYFEDEVQRFLHELEMAQLFALMLQSEIKVDFERTGHEWKAKFSTDEVILERWRPACSFKHVPYINARNLIIDAAGRIEPKVCLKFSSQNSTHWIDCREPLSIKFSKHPREEDAT